MSAETVTVPGRQLAAVTPAEWDALASRRIFFGHQSVGRNIMSGVRAVLADHPEIGLRLAETDDPATVEGPALIDANIGENRRPETKTAAFGEVLRRGLGEGALALYKFCYVDVDEATDVDALFADYVAETRRIREAHPEVTLVHVTLPLRTVREGVRDRLARLLGRTTELDLNVRRNRYNDLLRSEYEGIDPIFDLARLQSTRPDGSRSFVRHQAREIYMLAPEWTYDDGHLNEAGERYVAERFLVTLAEIAARTPDPAVGAVHLDGHGHPHSNEIES